MDRSPRFGLRAAMVALAAWFTAHHVAHADPGAPAAALPDGVVVTAKLVEIPSKLPPDDLYDYAYVMRYEVVGGPHDKASILVAHYRPRVPRAKITGKMKGVVSGKLRSFVQGDVHKLKLASDLKQVWKGPLIDEFAAADRKSVRYFCLIADPS